MTEKSLIILMKISPGVYPALDAGVEMTLRGLLQFDTIALIEIKGTVKHNG